MKKFIIFAVFKQSTDLMKTASNWNYKKSVLCLIFIEDMVCFAFHKIKSAFHNDNISFHRDYVISTFIEHSYYFSNYVFSFIFFRLCARVEASEFPNEGLLSLYESGKLDKVDLGKSASVTIDTEVYDSGFDFSHVTNSVEAHNVIIEYAFIVGVELDLEFTLFDSFCKESSLDFAVIINNYILQINEIAEENTIDNSYVTQQSPQSDIYSGFDNILTSSSSSSSGGQAWYYNTGTELPQPANYSSNNLLAVAKKGDIVYEATGFFGLTGHSAIVEGKFYSTAQNQYYIRIIEAISPGGVSRNVLDCTRLVDREGSLYRVSGATSDEINNAVAFAISQLGKPYWLDLAKDTSSDEANWYCSELVWASYKNQDIDIEVSGTSDKNPGIWPIDIVNDEETYYLVLTPTPSC